MRNRFNRRDDFDRNFSLMNKVFWIFFAVILTLIIGQFALMGWAGYQLFTDPEGTANTVGNILGEVIRPVADAVRGE
jgi:hypothetical protein